MRRDARVKEHSDGRSGTAFKITKAISAGSLLNGSAIGKRERKEKGALTDEFVKCHEALVGKRNTGRVDGHTGALVEVGREGMDTTVP